jgi:hypothetical protein
MGDDLSPSKPVSWLSKGLAPVLQKFGESSPDASPSPNKSIKKKKKGKKGDEESVNPFRPQTKRLKEYYSNDAVNSIFKRRLEDADKPTMWHMREPKELETPELNDR